MVEQLAEQLVDKLFWILGTIVILAVVLGLHGCKSGEPPPSAEEQARAVVQEFGECLRAAVGEGLHHDRAVGVVLFVLELGGPFVGSVDADDEGAELVWGCGGAFQAPSPNLFAGLKDRTTVWPIFDSGLHCIAFDVASLEPEFFRAANDVIVVFLLPKGTFSI